jgi:perosamine synthetase
MEMLMIHLSRPDITEREIQAVVEVLRSPNLSLGPKVPEFESAVAKYVGTKFGIAVNSGTSGLYLCIEAMGIKPGDEIITTPFTFIATINCIMMAGAKPVFVDIDPVSMNIDPKRIEAAITKKTKAIFPVIVFGNPWGIDEVCAIGKKHNLPVLEDSCEALGSVYKGKKAGAFGIAGCFGLYPNKQCTTGEGGMIVTDDEKLADMCMCLRNQGRGKGGGWLAHDRLGYNYRLSDINCAMGIVQISRIEEIKAKRKRAAGYYQEMLADETRVMVPKEPADCDMSWFVFVVRLADRYTGQQRDAILKKMIEKGVQVSNYFPPAHLQPFMVRDFGYKLGDFPITDSVCKSTIALPFYNNLTKDDAATVCKMLRQCLDEIDK